ncbi:MAG: class II aldolase/adducin family protein [Deltaproteobacteria bacterium]|nr:class II aldolase/adducin family protein [Deltaproteobacteria bacterium]
MTTFRLRKQVVLYSHRLDSKGFVANHDGNISARLADENRFLATPTGRGKFDLKDADLIVVDAAGKTKAGGAKIFGEWPSHAEIYKTWPQVTAVVHAHLAGQADSLRGQ